MKITNIFIVWLIVVAIALNFFVDIIVMIIATIWSPLLMFATTIIIGIAILSIIIVIVLIVLIDGMFND